MLIAITLLALAGAALAEYHDYDYYSGDHDSYSHGHEQKYHGPPAPLKHDGTVDYTPEVKHARAAHFAALQAYKSSFPHGGHHYHSEHAHGPYSHNYQHSPAPVDDLPEVKAARAAHFAEYSKALYRHKRSYGLGAPLKHDGTVDETPEVKHAKAEHFAALAQAKSHYPHHDYHSHSGYHKFFEPAPLNHDGTVADTDDIKHAKSVLFKAHNEAMSRLHSSPHYPHYPSYDDHSDYSYSGKYHGPPAPLNHDGTVAETPEVKNAKAIHFHLFNQALHRYKRAAHFQPAPLNADGTVAETPEVQQAKAAFFAAHAAEMAHADSSWVEPEYHDEPSYNNYVEPVHYSFPSSSKPLYDHHDYNAPSSDYSPSSDFTPSHFSKHFEPAPLNHDGTVADTPAIKQAKAIHFAAHQQVKPYQSAFHGGYSASSHSPAIPHYNHAPSLSHYSSSPVHSNFPYTSSPSHFSHKPVIPAPLNHDGTVAETPEIQAAKSIHFAAHQEAFARAIPQKYSHHHY